MASGGVQKVLNLTIYVPFSLFVLDTKFGQDYPNAFREEGENFQMLMHAAQTLDDRRKTLARLTCPKIVLIVALLFIILIKTLHSTFFLKTILTKQGHIKFECASFCNFHTA